MSLLLDALHRASKDKERAAAAGNAGISPLKIKDAVASTEDFPRLQETPAVPAATPRVELTPSAPTELSLEAPDVVRVKAEAPAAVEPSAAPTAPAWEMSQSVTETPAVAEPVIPAPVAAPAPAASRALETSPPAARVAADSEAKSPPAASKAAQEIRRAYAPDGKDIASASAGSRRVWLLGGVALVLAMGLVSVLLGLWGDPMRWIGAAPLQALTPAAPLANPEPTEPAAVAQTTVPTVVAEAATGEKPMRAASVAAAPSASSVLPRARKATERFQAATAKPAQSGGSNDVTLRNDAGRPGFVAKARGANALETGYTALLDGKLDAASQAYSQALRDNPEERDALLGLAYVAHKKGQREQAQDLYRRVLRQDPNNTVASVGLIALDTEADSALTTSRARELVQQQPDSAAAAALAAGALARDGQVAEAAQLFARAQQLEPSNAMHAYNFAVALDRLGQYPAARIQYEKAMQLANRGTNANVRTFSLDAVKLRIDQLTQGGLAQAEAVR